MTVLDTIIERKSQEVDQLKAVADERSLRRLAGESPEPRNLISALKHAPHVPIIAEIKRASPSAGTIKELADVPAQARSYEHGGAAALSVLTDGPFFRGSLDDLRQAREAVKLPILRKDFIVDPIQLYESRIAQADAVLLIAAALSWAQLQELFLESVDLGMTPVVEVHDEAELSGILALRPPIVGINNRNLRTMEVNLETCLRLRPLVPMGTVILAESGISGPADVQRLLDGGVDAFLVGTTLMRSQDPSATLAELCRAGR
jgi:indole-3-glycerol phosphate synthase